MLHDRMAQCRICGFLQVTEEAPNRISSHSHHVFEDSDDDIHLSLASTTSLVDHAALLPNLDQTLSRFGPSLR